MLSLLATVCAGLFSGAAIYVNLVEHPARLSCGTELAVKEFGPSYRRGTVMQASLALVGCALGLAAWARGGDRAVLIAAVLLGAVVPFTLIVLLPTNKQLLDPSLDSRSAMAAELLSRWGWLHGVRDRKSTRLNSSHSQISYAVFCLKKKTTDTAVHMVSSQTMTWTK